MTALAMLADSIAVTQAPERPEKAMDGTFTLQGLSILVGLMLAVITIVGFMRKTRRENEADALARSDRLMTEMTKHNDSFEGRLKTQEVRSADFMPRAEIEKAIDHLKVNRQQAEAGLKDRGDAAARDIVEIRVAFGKLEQKQDGLASDVGEIKSLVKEQGRDTASRFDRLQDCLSKISRQVGPTA